MATKKRLLDTSFKLSVIEDAKKTTNRTAARKFHVDNKIMEAEKREK